MQGSDQSKTAAEVLGTDFSAVNEGSEPAPTIRYPSGHRAKVKDAPTGPTADPVEAVLDEVKAHDVDLLVIGLKRRSPMGKPLLGSVSQRLLLESPVPVVAVKLLEEPGVTG